MRNTWEQYDYIALSTPYYNHSPILNYIASLITPHCFALVFLVEKVCVYLNFQYFETDFLQTAAWDLFWIENVSWPLTAIYYLV